MENEKIPLLGMTLDELREVASEVGLPAFAAKQLADWLYKKKVTQILSKEWLNASDRVLIIDDFMANGEAMRGLCDIVKAAGATLVGIGCAVEKGFQGGGDRLRAAGVNLKSLAIIESAEPGNIVFRDED